MNQIRLHHMLLVALAASGLSPVAEGLASESSRASAAQVVSVDGTVFIRPDGRSTSESGVAPAKSGDVVRVGDVINTASNSKIKLLMNDKSIVDIGPSALFKVNSYAKNGGDDRQIDTTMVYGSIRAAVSQKLKGKGSFKVHTPGATMGVRGTEFVVKSEVQMNPASAGGFDKKTAKTEVTVLQGRVDVASQISDKKSGFGGAAPQVLSLTAGKQFTADPSVASASAPVVTLDTKQMSSLKSESKVADNTFEKAVVVETSQKQGESRSPAQATQSSAASSGGAATLEMLATALQAQPRIDMPVVDVPGRIRAEDGLRPVVHTPGLKRLKVVVKQ